MELTRRDALAALIAGGVGTGAVGTAALASDGRLFRDLDAIPGIGDEVDTIVAAADVIYPPEVEGIPGFVRAYVSGLPESDRDEMGAAAERLDVGGLQHYDRRFADLPPRMRNDILYDLGVHLAESKPRGEPAERIRYHLVNELLYALFTSPKGSRLVGIDNPVGHPGGYDSYRERP